jgi:hypothetical protein
MSSSDLYVLNQKSTTWLASFRNGWGSAPAAWDYLGKKYFPGTYHSMLDTELRKVWELFSDTSLPGDERIVLALTFDRSYIPTAHLKGVGEACITFGTKSDDHERVNNWTEIGHTLINMHGRRFSRFARGVALSCTSVSDPWCEPTDDQLSRAWSIFREADDTPVAA